LVREEYERGTRRGKKKKVGREKKAQTFSFFKSIENSGRIQRNLGKKRKRLQSTNNMLNPKKGVVGLREQTQYPKHSDQRTGSDKRFRFGICTNAMEFGPDVKAGAKKNGRGWRKSKE